MLCIYHNHVVLEVLFCIEGEDDPNCSPYPQSRLSVSMIVGHPNRCYVQQPKSGLLLGGLDT